MTSEVLYRHAVGSAMLESQWRAQVMDMALLLGWKVYAVENATREIVRRSGARVRVRNVSASGVGFPDLVLTRRRDRRLVFAELKRDHRATQGGDYAVTPEQEAWLEDLRAASRRTDTCNAPAHAGFEVYVWRPADVAAVEQVLT